MLKTRSPWMGLDQARRVGYIAGYNKSGSFFMDVVVV
jgi:hypothetical protein